MSRARSTTCRISPATFGTAVAVTVGLVLCGCGSDKPADAVRSATPNAGTESGLGTEAFNALDRVFVASPPLDRFNNGPGFAAAAQPAHAACKALEKADARLRPLGRACSIGLELNGEILVFTDCVRAITRHKPVVSQSACDGSPGQIHSLLRAIRRQARHNDRVIRRTAFAPACRHALITKARKYAIWDANARAFARLASTRSDADFSEAWRLLAAANRDLPSTNLDPPIGA